MRDDLKDFAYHLIKVATHFDQLPSDLLESTQPSSEGRPTSARIRLVRKCDYLLLLMEECIAETARELGVSTEELYRESGKTVEAMQKLGEDYIAAMKTLREAAGGEDLIVAGPRGREINVTRLLVEMFQRSFDP